MNTIDFGLLLKILTAHLLSDFIFQTRITAKKKNKRGFRSKHLYIHTLITAVTLWLLIWDPDRWPLVLIIALTHFIIDGSKSLIKKNDQKIWVFLGDQVLHLIIIFTVWLLFTNQYIQILELFLLTCEKVNFWMIVLGLISVTSPSSVLIGLLTRKWSCDIDPGSPQSISDKYTGLKDAGKWIGILERVLIYTFILINQIIAIGFLLTAKSVFRFGDLTNTNDHKKTEYIIIGTLLSFSTAILIGLAVRYLVK